MYFFCGFSCLFFYVLKFQDSSYNDLIKAEEKLWRKGGRKLSSKEKTAGIASNALRAGIILMIVLLFIPDLNPAKISKLIGDGTSLLTSGFFYSSLTAKMGRAFSKGWIQESSIILLFLSCMICSIGTVVSAVGGCMTLGNLKCRRIGNIFRSR